MSAVMDNLVIEWKENKSPDRTAELGEPVVTELECENLGLSQSDENYLDLGANRSTLDGSFAASDLRKIADAMDKLKPNLVGETAQRFTLPDGFVRFRRYSPSIEHPADIVNKYKSVIITCLERDIARSQIRTPEYFNYSDVPALCPERNLFCLDGGKYIGLIETDRWDSVLKIECAVRGVK